MKIITDSGCDSSNDVLEKYDLQIESVPLHLQLGNTEYMDDENLDVKEYLRAMKECKSTPKSAAPTPESFLSRIKGEGSVFLITLASTMSSSYNNALLAKKMYLDEIGEKSIHVFDSLSASTGQLQIAIKINEFLKSKLPDYEIVERVNRFIEDMRTYFVLESYDNLVKTGRLSPYIAAFAKILNIKPICKAVNGNIIMSDKVRSYKKAYARLIEIIQSEKVDFQNRILGITHVDCVSRALEFKEEILKKIKFKDVLIVEAKGLCSNYADREGIIVTF